MKLISGPMATISHPAFRILVEEFGDCDEYFTEMINAGTLLTNGPFEKFYINPYPVPQKVVWQLTGHSIENMIKACDILCNLEGMGIDLNMGCSAPDIYRFGSGIAWMLKDIEETKTLVREINSVIKNYNLQNPQNKKRFSVKCRLGDDDFTEDKFFSFCDMLVENGCELITLHPRTKKEKLIRPPRYHYCNDLALRYKNAFTDRKIDVYLNGNVKDDASYKNAVSVCPDVDGVMISRAAVQQPWIFTKIKNPQKKVSVDMKQIALSYIKNIELYQPREFWKTRLQRFFTYYSLNFKFSHYAQTQFLNAKDNEDLILRIEDFFTKCPEEKFLNF